MSEATKKVQSGRGEEEKDYGKHSVPLPNCKVSFPGLFHFILPTGGKQQAFCSLGTRVGKKKMVLTDDKNRS